MSEFRKQSDTGYPLFFFMVDSADHIAGKTGLSPTVTISKNGAAYGSPSGAVSEVGSGLYKIAGNATDSNTLGELWIHATATGADPTDTKYTIVPYDPFDGVRLGLTGLANAVPGAAGGLFIAGSNAATTVNFTGNLSGSVGSVTGAVGSVTAAVTLPSIPANWITAAGIAASALNGKGDWLLAGGYTAPDNVSIAAIKARTDIIPDRPASIDSTGAQLASL
jgi:hypothetical protein